MAALQVRFAPGTGLLFLALCGFAIFFDNINDELSRALVDMFGELALIDHPIALLSTRRGSGASVLQPASRKQSCPSVEGIFWTSPSTVTAMSAPKDWAIPSPLRLAGKNFASASSLWWSKHCSPYSLCTCVVFFSMACLLSSYHSSTEYSIARLAGTTASYPRESFLHEKYASPLTRCWTSLMCLLHR